VSELTETQERFLRDVAKRLPLERVGEAYVFAPMRQGGMETGVAVIAVALEAPVEPDVADPPVAGEACATVDERVHEALDEIQASVASGEAPDAVIDPLVAATADTADDAADDAANEVLAAMQAAADADEVDVTADEAGVGDVETADVEEVAAPATSADAELHDAPLDTDAPPAGAPAASPPARYTVFTARYRLQLKGPDRGKWEVDVVEEADAPLLTVDAVVRGVQRRAGDEIEAERLTAADFLAVVNGQATWPATR
jgi:hypothetical protein